jgi:hypothetical protein
MSSPLAYISIDKFQHITRIANNSEYDILVSIKPIKPKRKYTDIALVAKGTFAIYEKSMDLSRLSISFINGEKNE